MKEQQVLGSVKVSVRVPIAPGMLFVAMVMEK
jgi:hypothetical protein